MLYIFDGEVHSLDNEYFYIIERYKNDGTFKEKAMKRKFLDKYIWYLFSVDFTAIEIENIINLPKGRFQFIHKKPLNDQCGTYCIKFKKENR